MSSKHTSHAAWAAKARSVRIEDEITRRGIKLRTQGVEHVGPCPHCAGDDRFAINTKKQVFNCRGCDARGDVIALVEFLDGCDFKAACTTLAGESPNAKSNGRDQDASARKIIVAEFSYHDESGAAVFVVERIEFQKPDGSYVLKDRKRKKSFRQKRPNPDKPGHWIFKTDGVPPLPYRLLELQEAVGNGQTILIVEGEAKVDLLHDWNVPATCCSGGAKKWKPEHAAYLRDADVVILPDNDDTGREHVKAVAASLQDVAANVRVLDLPNLLPKGDVIDWANNGGTVEQLHKLIVSQARQWTPNECHDDQRAPEFSDDNLALQFAERHAEGWRYVASRTRWLFWEKCHWLVDETLRAFDLARSICREAAAQCDKPRAAGLIASARTVAAVERLAKTDRRIAATTEQWDADLEIFNTPMKEQKA